MESPPFAQDPYEYDVCLSYAGEDRGFVQQVAAILVSFGYRVFYDLNEEAELWGKDLGIHLHHVYNEAARFCVVFISEHYASKVWTKREFASALARSIVQQPGYILPARFDSTEIPGLSKTIAYIDLHARSPYELCLLLKRKIDGEPQSGSTSSLARPLIQGKSFSGVWYGTWSGTSSFVFGCKLALKIYPSGKIRGCIDWTLKFAPASYDQSKLNLEAKEYVHGLYDAPSTLTFKGSHLEDPHSIIAMDFYSLQISEDRLSLTGKTFHHGEWGGSLSAKQL